MAIESAGQRVATSAREQVFVPLAISQRIKYVPDPRDIGAAPDRPFEVDEVDAGENGVERDRRHFRDPAADEDVGAGAGKHAQTGEECSMVESEHNDAGQRQSGKYPVAKPIARTLVEKDHDDAVEEEDRG